MFKFGKRNHDNDLSIARDYVERCGNSGMTRHYRAEAVADMIKYKTGASITDEEAATLIQDYRVSHGEKPLERNRLFPARDKE